MVLPLIRRRSATSTSPPDRSTPSRHMDRSCNCCSAPAVDGRPVRLSPRRVVLHRGRPPSRLGVGRPAAADSSDRPDRRSGGRDITGRAAVTTGTGDRWRGHSGGGHVTPVRRRIPGPDLRGHYSRRNRRSPRGRPSVEHRGVRLLPVDPGHLDTGTFARRRRSAVVGRPWCHRGDRASEQTPHRLAGRGNPARPRGLRAPTDRASLHSAGRFRRQSACGVCSALRFC